MRKKSKSHSSRKRSVKHTSHKVKHHVQEEKGVSYLAVDSPLEARKMLLSGAIDATYGLRDFQKYHELKKLKMDRMTQVRNILTQIEKELNKLRGAVPKEKEIQYLEAQMEEQKPKDTKPKVEEVHKSKLELEIEELSKRLEVLGKEV